MRNIILNTLFKSLVYLTVAYRNSGIEFSFGQKEFFHEKILKNLTFHIAFCGYSLCLLLLKHAFDVRLQNNVFSYYGYNLVNNFILCIGLIAKYKTSRQDR